MEQKRERTRYIKRRGWNCKEGKGGRADGCFLLFVLMTVIWRSQGLAVALEFPAKVDASDRELLRWLGEPVLFASLSTSSFVENKQGFPVLPRKQKSLLLELFHHPCKVLLSGEGRC